MRSSGDAFARSCTGIRFSSRLAQAVRNIAREVTRFDDFPKLTTDTTLATILGDAGSHSVCAPGTDESSVFVSAHWYEIPSANAPATEDNQLRIGNTGSGSHGCPCCNLNSNT